MLIKGLLMATLKDLSERINIFLSLAILLVVLGDQTARMFQD